MNVQKYASEVVDSYKDNREHKGRVTFAHASNAEKDHGVGFSSGAKIAEQAMNRYDQYRDKGASHDAAKEMAASDMGQRFSPKGRDLDQPVRQQPSRSAGMSL